MIDIEIFKQLMFQGRADDLLKLLEGESMYTSCSVEDHLNFVSKFGFDVDKIVEGGMVYSERREGFNTWLKMGAPGIEPDELEAYLNDHPLV